MPTYTASGQKVPVMFSAFIGFSRTAFCFLARTKHPMESCAIHFPVRRVTTHIDLRISKADLKAIEPEVTF